MGAGKEIVQYEPVYDFSEITGQFFWKEVLGGMIHEEFSDEFLGMQTARGILLTGPEGFGKTTLGQAYLGELRKRQYNTLYIRRSQLRSWKDQPEKLAEEVCTKCRTYLKSAVFFDDVEILEELPELAESLAEGFESLLENDVRTIWIFAAKEITSLPEDLKNRCLLCEVKEPGLEERMEFFNGIDVISGHSERSVEQMARETEGCSMGELSRMAYYLLMCLKQELLRKYGQDFAQIQKMLKNRTSILSGTLFEQALQKIRKAEVQPVQQAVYPPYVMMQSGSGQPEQEMYKKSEEVQPENEDDWMDEIDDL